MKRNLGYAVLLAVLCVIFAVPAVSQSATIKGVCKDVDGKPIVGAELSWHNEDNGRTFTVKTDAKGEYFRLGLDSGRYTVTLSKDGNVLDSVKNFHMASEETTLDFDLKKSQEDTAKQAGMTGGQAKQVEQAKESVEKYNANVKIVNDKLKLVTEAVQPPKPDYDKAIGLLNESIELVPNENLIWYRRGVIYLDSARAQTDPAEKTKRYTSAYNDLQKAIELKKSAMSAPPPPGAKAPAAGAVPDNIMLAAFYDNLAAAAAKTGKPDEAADDYKQATTLDPAGAGPYFLNLGILLTNTNIKGDPEVTKQAVDAFDKAIAADPKNAEAYYLKGTDLIGLSNTNNKGKVVGPPGTADAFQKYLELQPTGAHAADAKNMLALLGSTVETNYGTKKKK